MYVTKLSSLPSLLTRILLAGYALGTMLRRTFRRELVTTSDAIDTKLRGISDSLHWEYQYKKLTAALISKDERSSLLRPATDIAHDCARQDAQRGFFCCDKAKPSV